MKRMVICLASIVVLSLIGVVAADGVRILEISGFVDARGEVSFSPSHAIVLPADILEDWHGDFSFSAMSAQDLPLATVSFEMIDLTGAGEELVRGFVFYAPFPGGTSYFAMHNPQGQLIATLPVASQMPLASFVTTTVSIDDPFSLEWIWHSPQGLELYAELYYVYDFYSVLLDYDLTETSFVVSFEGLDLPLAENAMFLLVVSDGANTIEVYSNLFATAGQVTLYTGELFPVLDPADLGDHSPLLRDQPITMTIASPIVSRGFALLPAPPVTPVIINERTMLPFRYLVETVLGGQVAYEEATRRITAQVSGLEVVMVVDQLEIQINGESHNFGQAPVIIDGFTLVPLRAFEALFSRLTWEQESQSVVLVP